MQQFATTQTNIAANKLPFEDVKLSSSASRNTSSSSFDGSAQKSAFEEALARQEQSSQSTAKNVRNEDENVFQRAESARNNEANDARQDSIDRANERSQTRQDNKDLTQRRAETNARQQSDNTQQNKNIGNEHTLPVYDTEDEQGHAAVFNDDAAIAIDVLSAQKLTAENITDDFDWVAYVNKVKDLSDSSDVTPIDLYIEDKTSVYDIFAQTIASLNSESDAVTNARPVATDILNAGSDPEFLEISLTQEELATLINAAGGNSDEQLNVNSEAMNGLDNAIAKLLNQLVSKEQTDESVNAELELVDTTKDADLLKDLLQAAALETTDKQKIPILLETAPDQSNAVLKSDVELERATKPIDNNILTDNIKESEIASQKLAEPDLRIVKVNDNLAPKAVESTVSAQAGLADVVNAALSQAAKPVVERSDKATESPLFVPVDKASTKKQAQLLAQLPPEAQTSAIDNIATRVESVISELKTEGKATEFIAALQSGVKEMKEQLKQGREPGIDLKSLVTDALAAADVKVTTNTEVALDKQLNQITNILAAVTSLNQTNQQQNYLNTGLNEVQGVKDLTQLQIESTKLAQQTTANDKAVNIFKPEGQQQLTEKVRWMVNSRNISAEIRLDPPDLGGMNIKVNLSGDSASVSFVVQSQHARDVLDQAVPRLREMLEEHGIELGQSSVQQDSSGGDAQAEQGSLANNSNDSGNLAQQSQDETQDLNEDSVLGTSDVIEQRISGGRIGGIDHYA